ncbi:MAG: hypothetical protein IPI49_14660 [Myxococcales bacterium]|nr:hypothetical protein [Myxococcales bacterium]
MVRSSTVAGSGTVVGSGTVARVRHVVEAQAGSRGVAETSAETLA